LDIVQKNLEDRVIKTIMMCLVNNTCDSLQRELVGKIYKEGKLFSKLLNEYSDIPAKREECRTQLKVLHEANQILQSEVMSSW